ncbi:MAG: endonuclease/exonuclease/phosphatase family protein [Gammaproteobacteria bacterium]|nr:endonuclease/exonuclease/phosphatase family protein [Gammaproteobacteria bacterium]
MRLFFLRSSQLSVILLILLTLAGYLGGAFRYFELTSHFRVQYLALSLLVVAVFFVLRSKLWIVLALLATSINSYEIVPIYWPHNDPRILASGTEFTLLLANVQRSNTEYSRLIEVVNVHRPDLLAVIEPDTAWIQALNILTPPYPHQKIVARDDNFGIALYSRIPFDDVEVIDLGDTVPSIAAKILLDKKEVTILATHPLPPPAKQNYHRRNSQLSAIATYIDALPGSKIIIGDLNVTLWSTYFSKLLHDTGLLNTRQGYGTLATWPTYLPLMMIPLDHCLVSPDIMTKDITALSNIGSDHLPLLVKLEI